MKFDMSITDNYASFIDEETGDAIFVDSFDNEEFEVRIGTLDSSVAAGSILAKTFEELNLELASIYKKFQGGKG